MVLNFAQSFFARIKFRGVFEIAKITKISKNKIDAQCHWGLKV